MLSKSEITSQKLASAYLWVTICAGGLIYLAAGYRFDTQKVDLQFAVIAILTIFLSSRITIRIPQFDSQISVSDTFIFLTLLLYGYEAAILMAATEALLSSFRFCRKRSTIFFNWGCAALSACVTSYSLHFVFGDVVSLGVRAVVAQVHLCHGPDGPGPIRIKLRDRSDLRRLQAGQANLANLEETLPLDLDYIFCGRIRRRRHCKARSSNLASTR